MPAKTPVQPLFKIAAALPCVIILGVLVGIAVAVSVAFTVVLSPLVLAIRSGRRRPVAEGR